MNKTASRGTELGHLTSREEVFFSFFKKQLKFFNLYKKLNARIPCQTACRGIEALRFYMNKTASRGTELGHLTSREEVFFSFFKKLKFFNLYKKLNARIPCQTACRGIEAFSFLEK